MVFSLFFFCPPEGTNDDDHATDLRQPQLWCCLWRWDSALCPVPSPLDSPDGSCCISWQVVYHFLLGNNWKPIQCNTVCKAQENSAILCISVKQRLDILWRKNQLFAEQGALVRSEFNFQARLETTELVITRNRPMTNVTRTPQQPCWPATLSWSASTLPLPRNFSTPSTSPSDKEERQMVYLPRIFYGRCEFWIPKSAFLSRNLGFKLVVEVRLWMEGWYSCCFMLILQ